MRRTGTAVTMPVTAVAAVSAGRACVASAGGRGPHRPGWGVGPRPGTLADVCSVPRNAPLAGRSRAPVWGARGLAHLVGVDALHADAENGLQPLQIVLTQDPGTNGRGDGHIEQHDRVEALAACWIVSEWPGPPRAHDIGDHRREDWRHPHEVQTKARPDYSVRPASSEREPGCGDGQRDPGRGTRSSPTAPTAPCGGDGGGHRSQPAEPSPLRGSSSVVLGAEGAPWLRKSGQVTRRPSKVKGSPWSAAPGDLIRRGGAGYGESAGTCSAGTTAPLEIWTTSMAFPEPG